MKTTSTRSTDILFFALVFICLLIASLFGSGRVHGQTVTCKDTTIHKVKEVTSIVVTQVPYDSTYQKCDTIILPPVTELKGFYVAYDAFTLGSATSENAFLLRMKNMGVNMLNYYARAKLYSSSDRDKIAAWVKKAKEQYGMVLITIDCRTDSREYPAWLAYYQKYAGTTSMIEPLTEFEPYRLDASGVYPYPAMFTLLQKFDALTKQYGAVLNWYEGWIGKYYSNPQGAVDSMVLHCGRIFVSNYVSMSRYNSSVWDGSMINRVGYGATDYGGITVSCKKFKKVIGIVEIQSIEPEFLQLYYSCPISTTKKCKPFFGTTWETTKTKYNQVSSSETLQYTDLIGKTIFYTTLLPATGQ